MDNLRKYNEAFIDVFSVEEKDLNSNFTREQVKDWDSIHQLNLITFLEDEFNVMFDTDDALSLVSYDKGKEILKLKYKVEF